jgi:hypothetical protein
MKVIVEVAKSVISTVVLVPMATAATDATSSSRVIMIHDDFLMNVPSEV